MTHDHTEIDKRLQEESVMTMQLELGSERVVFLGDAKRILHEEISRALKERDEEVRDEIKEIKKRAEKVHEENHQLAPNAYGTGVEWGIIETCDDLIGLLAPAESLEVKD